MPEYGATAGERKNSRACACEAPFAAGWRTRPSADLFVHGVGEIGAQHLVERLLAPRHIAWRLIRIPRIENRVVVARLDRDCRAHGEAHRLSINVHALPRGIPMVDLEETPTAPVGENRFDVHRLTQQVHVP